MERFSALKPLASESSGGPTGRPNSAKGIALERRAISGTSPVGATLKRIAHVIFLTLVVGTSVAQTAANKPYKVTASLKEVANAKTFVEGYSLTDGQRALLAKNLFFTYPLGDAEMFWVYGRNDYKNLSSIVTADNVLQIYHVFFESTLRIAEQTALNKELLGLTSSMLSQAAKTYQDCKGTPLESAALKNLAYFGLASSLSGKPAKMPAVAKAMVDQELALIKAHQGFAKSAIFPYEIDYSQFIPRGHYTKTPLLTRYFLTMMLYGLVPFSVEKTVNGKTVLIKEQLQQSLLLARDLELSKAKTRWQRIYDVTALFAGKSNNLTPGEWATACAKVFGAKPPVKAYSEDAKLRAFVNLARGMRQPPIVPVHRSRTGAVAGDLQLRFMGQRAIPDSAMLQRLSEPDMRPFPTGLDVMAVLGSARARQILDGNPKEFNAKGWREYGSQRKTLEAQFAAIKAVEWRRDLYWSWLDTLKPYLATVPSGYPSFMRSQAWTDRCLYSALASWAELRHDTILYGEQSVAEMGGGEDEPPPFVKGYVEPNVAFYKRLKEFVIQTRDGLKSRGFLTKPIKDDATAFLGLLDFFLRVSQTELRNGKLAKKDHERIRHIEGELENLNYDLLRTAAGYQQLSQDDLNMALVADIHTAYGQALTVAVGSADGLVAVVPIEGKLYLAHGSSLSFYEFKVPVSGRLTDKQWQTMLESGEAPERPFWIKSFFSKDTIEKED